MNKSQNFYHTFDTKDPAAMEIMEMHESSSHMPFDTPQPKHSMYGMYAYIDL